jgi:SAM-dependent methyltransferase
MDRQTIEFYNAHSAETAQRYAESPSRIARFFPIAFPPGTRVLDLGCGSARDLNELLQRGHAAVGIDASAEMIRQAASRFPQVADKLTLDHLPELQTVPDGSFDGVVCSAVLMHLPEEFLFDTVFNIRRILRKGGHLLISTPLTGPDVDGATRRDAQGRLFNGVTSENFQFLFEKVGFRQMNRWDTDDALGRTERRWATQLFVLESQGSRSLDKIEGILNRDKKDANLQTRPLSRLGRAGHDQLPFRDLASGRKGVPPARPDCRQVARVLLAAHGVRNLHSTKARGGTRMPKACQTPGCT